MSKARPVAAARPLRPVRCHDTAWPCARRPLVSAAPIVSSSSTTNRSATAVDGTAQTCAGPVRRPLTRACLPSAHLRRTGRWPAIPDRGTVRTRAAGIGTSRVLVVSGSVGAGHDGAARELATRLQRAGVEVAVRDFLDAVPPPVARLLREGYTTTVEWAPVAFEALFRGLERRGPLWWAEQQLCAYAARTVARWATEFRPDAVVSTYPPASQAVGALRADGRLAAPAYTYLTDPAVHVSWLHPAVDRALDRHRGHRGAWRGRLRRGAGGGRTARAGAVRAAPARRRGGGAARRAHVRRCPSTRPARLRLLRYRGRADRSGRRPRRGLHRCRPLRPQRNAAPAPQRSRCRRAGLARRRPPADAGRRRPRAERRGAVVHRVARGRPAGGDPPADPRARPRQCTRAG